MSRRLRFLAFIASVWLTPGIVCGASAQKKPVTLSDLADLQPADVTIDLSSDGRQVAYSVDGRSIWVTTTHGRAQPTAVGDGFFPKWAPAGDKLSFYRVSDPDGIQLWVFHLTERKSVQVTDVAGGIDPDPATRIAGPVRDAFRYSWSPDGSSIVFASRVPVAAGKGEAPTSNHSVPSTDPLILTQSTPPSWTLHGVFADAPLSLGTLESRDGRSVSAKRDHEPGAVLLSQLFVVSVSTGETRRLQSDASNDFSPHWSPDGTRILCAATARENEVFGAGSINIHVIEVASGQRKALTAGAGVRSRPTWSASGDEFAFMERPTFFGQTALVVGSREGTDFRVLTAELDRDVRQFAWITPKSMLVTYRDGVSLPLAIIDDTRSPRVTVVSPRVPNVPVSLGEIAASSGAAAWTESTADRPGALYFARSVNKSPALLVDFYPQVQDLELGSAQVVRWRTATGEEKEGALLRPARAKPGSRLPLIVDAYPLGTGNDWLDAMSGNQAWAALGYAVFRPSPRSPNAWVNHWKGRQSSEIAKGPAGWDIAVDDVLSGIDELIKRGWVDENRMCLFGFSNGGTVVSQLVARTHRFKCAIAVASAMSDWIRPAFLNTDQLHLLAMWAGGPNIWEDPERYVRLSPVFQLDKVRTPMLLAVGDRDGDFLLNSIELYNALRSAGTAVTLLRYPGQGHGFTGAALEDFWKREVSFVAEHLGGNHERGDRLIHELPASSH